MIRLPRTVLAEALIGVQTDEFYGDMVDENYGEALHMEQPCLGLKFTYTSDAVRFMVDLTLALQRLHGQDVGGRHAAMLAEASGIRRDGSWWVLFFPLVGLED